MRRTDAKMLADVDVRLMAAISKLNPGSIAGVATRLQDVRSRIQIPTGTRTFSLVQESRLALDAPSLLFCAYQRFFSGCKAASVYKVNHHLHPAMVKNEWRCTSTPLTCRHGEGRTNFILHYQIPRLRIFVAFLSPASKCRDSRPTLRKVTAASFPHPFHRNIRNPYT
jgi:hypothetical protein